MSTEAYNDMQSRDVALAVAASNRIIIDLLISAGVPKDAITAAYRAKADDLIDNKSEQNAANLLRMMSGAIQPDE